MRPSTTGAFGLFHPIGFLLDESPSGMRRPLPIPPPSRGGAHEVQKCAMLRLVEVHLAVCNPRPHPELRPYCMARHVQVSHGLAATLPKVWHKTWQHLHQGAWQWVWQAGRVCLRNTLVCLRNTPREIKLLLKNAFFILCTLPSHLLSHTTTSENFKAS